MQRLLNAVAVASSTMAKEGITIKEGRGKKRLQATMPNREVMERSLVPAVPKPKRSKKSIRPQLPHVQFFDTTEALLSRPTRPTKAPKPVAEHPPISSAVEKLRGVEAATKSRNEARSKPATGGAGGPAPKAKAAPKAKEPRELKDKVRDIFLPLLLEKEFEEKPFGYTITVTKRNKALRTRLNSVYLAPPSMSRDSNKLYVDAATQHENGVVTCRLIVRSKTRPDKADIKKEFEIALENSELHKREFEDRHDSEAKEKRRHERHGSKTKATGDAYADF